MDGQSAPWAVPRAAAGKSRWTTATTAARRAVREGSQTWSAAASTRSSWLAQAMAIWSPIIKNLFTIGPAKASWSGSPRAPRHHLAARPVLRETQAGALHRTRPATANWPGSCGTAAPTCCRSPPTRRTTASSGGRSRPEPGDATTSKAGRLTPARLRRGQIGVFRQPLDRPSARTGVHRLNGGSSAGQVSTHPTSRIDCGPIIRNNSEPGAHNRTPYRLVRWDRQAGSRLEACGILRTGRLLAGPIPTRTSTPSRATVRSRTISPSLLASTPW